MANVTQKLKDKADAIHKSRLSGRQQQMMDAECLLHSLRHSFCVAPLTVTELRRLDSIRARLHKFSLGMPATAPHAAVYTPPDMGGLGATPMIAEYTQVCAETQITPLSHPGRLGTLARAFMHQLRTNDKTSKHLTIDSAPDNKGNVRNVSRSQYMMVRKHKILQAFNIVPIYDTEATCTSTSQAELWETVTHLNRTLHRNYPLTYIQQSICAPLWAAGVYKLSDLTTDDGTRLAQPQFLAAQFPALGSQSATLALRRLAALLCTDIPWKDTGIWERIPPVLPSFTNGEEVLLEPLRPTAGNAQQGRRRRQAPEPLDTYRVVPPYPCTTRVTVKTEEINPDVDIQPASRCSIYLDGTEPRQQAWLYSAAGKCIAAVTVRSLGRLAAMLASPEEELQRLVSRICMTALETQAHFVKQQALTQDWPPALHPDLAAAIVECFAPATDWLSHPLAQHGPFAAQITSERLLHYKWTGSGLANIPHTPEAVARCLKWAILSTYTATPTLTVCVLPTPAPGAASNRFLAHPRALTLAQVSSSRLVWQPKHYDDGCAVPRQRSFAATILIVANPAGAAALTEQQLLTWSGFMRAHFNAAAVSSPRWLTWKAALATAEQDLAPSTLFRAAPTLQPEPPAPFDETAFLSNLPLAATRTFRLDPATVIYTDGSKQDKYLGAAVYDGRRNKVTAIMPEGHAGQLNTVPKAEGTAILEALQAAPNEEDITILTDSLTLIHQIDSVLTNPTRWRIHKHKHMLKKIVHRLLSRAGATTIYKVRAHIGVTGNEIADKAAKIAADMQAAEMEEERDELTTKLHDLLPDGTATTQTHDDHVAGKPGFASSWLQYPVPSLDGDGTDLWSFDELKHQVNRHITPILNEALQRTYQIGSKIFARMVETSKDLAAIPDSAHFPMEDLPPGCEQPPWLATLPYHWDTTSAQLLSITANTPWELMRIGHQIRWEQFWTRAKAHRFYPATHQDPWCRCGDGCRQRQAETVLHYFGGCRNRTMQDMSLKRHGFSIMVMVDAIRKGAMGMRALFHDSELGDRTARNLPPAIPRLRGHTIPDIIFLPNTDMNELHTAPLHPLTPEKKTIACIEVTHTTDRGAFDALTRLDPEGPIGKLHQHAKWF